MFYLLKGPISSIFHVSPSSMYIERDSELLDASIFFSKVILFIFSS